MWRVINKHFAAIILLDLWLLAAPAYAQLETDEFLGRYENESGIAEISRMDEARSSPLYKISITVALSTGCMGDISGVGLKKEGKIIFLSDDKDSVCEVSASLASDKLELEEGLGCFPYHGARCGFTGKYERERIGQKQAQAEVPIATAPVNDNKLIGSALEEMVREQEEDKKKSEIERQKRINSAFDISDEDLERYRAFDAEEHRRSRAATDLTLLGLGSLSIIALMYFSYRQREKALLLASAALKSFSSRKVRGAVALYFLWVLLLLFTNGLLFRDLFEWREEYAQRLVLMATLPPMFMLAAYMLYLWVSQPDKAKTYATQQGQEKKQVSVKRSLIIPPTRNFSFYLIRAGLFIVFSIVLYFVEYARMLLSVGCLGRCSSMPPIRALVL